MAEDGGLRAEFRRRLRQVDWSSVESTGTDSGIPDMNGCLRSEFWIEMKKTDGWKPVIRPEQIGWAERRIRHGGNVFLAVRRKHDGGPRKGPPVDELWVYHGSMTGAVAMDGMQPHMPLIRTTGGPSKWDWDSVLFHILAACQGIMPCQK